jgi:hypothetical protein
MVRKWLPTTEAQDQFWIISSEICGRKYGNAIDFPPSFFGFPLLIIPPFLSSIHLSLLSEVQ